MKIKVVTTIALLALLGTQPALTADINVAGKYTAENGAVLTVEPTTESGQYRITARDPGDYFWEGIGYYSNDCKCIKSVFRYISHRDRYGDNPGYHKFEIKDNGDTLVKLGGWNSINEFRSDVFTRNK